MTAPDTGLTGTDTASHPDRTGRGFLSFSGQILGAGALAAVVTLAAWFVLARTNLPAYSSSNVTKALASAGGVIVLVVLALVLYALLHARTPVVDWPRWRRAGATVLCWLAPAGLVIAALAVPLAATRLYLDGISVDQAFRTQFFTRMTDQPGFEDMAYLGEPSFYPRLWFLTGGLFANVLGLAGWAAFQPWSLITLAVAGSMLVPVWHRLTGSLPLGSVIALVTTAVVLYTAPEEPYAAVVAFGMPAAIVLAGRAVRGSRPGIAGLAVFLGLSANLYTLYTGVSALTVVVIAVVVAWRTRAVMPLVRLTVIGVGSIVIALVGWAPYGLALLTSERGASGRAQHYLPQSGTEIPVPFFHVNLVGVLALLCIVWMVLRWRRSQVRALVAGLVVCYLWVLASMLTTLTGTTLLGFRMELPISLLLVTGGMMALEDLRVNGIRRAYPQFVGPTAAPKVTAVLAILLTFAAATHVINIPLHLRQHIDLAYSDTDGEAQRGDLFPADSTVYYADVDAYIDETLGLGGERAGTVVLTDEQSFMAYYPYHSYQAMTAHYANPLGRFEDRNAEIERWADISDPAELTGAMDTAAEKEGWTGPDVLVLRGQAADATAGGAGGGNADGEAGAGDPDGRFRYRLSEDIYPNDPNVRFTTISFHASAFSEGWDLEQIGPFVVAVRQR
ncbi:galactan 5-O-arabinofuranosyltransferase [Corynebacterium kalidii]|uniref:Galactan 5-O-arabinofuranosyltransferase n=1 Tax=Corynebacterium kalidii TaxID=2931982 RepID=A0A9X1WM54_9CORY|nr:galactan 5-O-arabinofuranosyltransferase [Corynebacterium kalidii]MCJ7857536.1 galactan 5-O-arabinofuranosyltransferase [Corynebacterium kalidii]